MPKVSIVIPVFNRERLIPRTIRSCLVQTEPDFEIVVVDDGSTDGSREAVRRFDDPRLRLFTQPQNMGAATARNRGAAEARADWVMFVDSDDELVPEALAIIVEKIEESGSDVAALWFRCRLDDGTLTPARIPKLGRLDLKDKLLLHEACIGKSTTWSTSAGAALFRTSNIRPTKDLKIYISLTFPTATWDASVLKFYSSITKTPTTNFPNAFATSIASTTCNSLWTA